MFIRNSFNTIIAKKSSTLNNSSITSGVKNLRSVLPNKFSPTLTASLGTGEFSRQFHTSTSTNNASVQLFNKQLNKSNKILPCFPINSTQTRTYLNIYNYNSTGENLLMLPPQTDPSKKTLVLDLDEVLATNDFMETTRPTYTACDYIMTKREGIDEFLLEMSKYYEIVLLTSSVKSYADENLRNMPNVFEHRRYRHHIPETDCIKRVSQMGRDMERIFFIDENSGYLEFNKENQILMPPINISKPEVNLGKLSDVLMRISKDEISIKDACAEWNKNIPV